MVKRIELLSDEYRLSSKLQGDYKFIIELNYDILKDICDLLEEGLPPTTACEYLGITTGIHKKWLEKGLNYINIVNEKSGTPEKDLKIYADYYIEVKKSVAKYLTTKIENVNGNFTPSWVRDITILERRDSANWGRNITVTEKEEIKNPDESFL